MHNHFLWTVLSWRYARGTNEVRSEYRLGAAGYGQSADGVRTEYRRDTDGVRTVYGQGTDRVRMGHGSCTNGVRTRYGRSTDGVRTGYGRHTVVKKKKRPPVCRSLGRVGAPPRRSEKRGDSIKINLEGFYIPTGVSLGCEATSIELICRACTLLHRVAKSIVLTLQSCFRLSLAYVLKSHSCTSSER